MIESPKAAQFFAYFLVDTSTDPPTPRPELYWSRAAARASREWNARNGALRVRRAKIILYTS